MEDSDFVLLDCTAENQNVETTEEFRTEGKYFNDQSLPEELWLYIFRFMSDPRLCRLSLVSKDWQRLSNDDSLWSEIWRDTYKDELPPNKPNKGSQQGLFKSLNFLKFWNNKNNDDNNSEKIDGRIESTSPYWKHIFLKRYSSFYARTWTEGRSNSVRIVLKETEYRAGQRSLVEGEVWLRTSSRIPCSALRVMIKSTEKLRTVNQTEHENFVFYIDVCGLLPVKVDNKEGTTTLYKKPIKQKSSNDKHIESGEWRFPFKFYIGPSISPTFHSIGFESKCQMIAFLDQTFLFFASKHILDLTILPKVNIPPECHKAQGLKQTLRDKSGGSITVTFVVQKRVCYPGKGSALSVKFENKSAKTFTQCTVKLFEVVHHSPEFIRQLVQKAVPMSERRWYFKNYTFNSPPNSTRIFNLHFGVPAAAIPTLATGRMNIDYIFQLEISQRPYSLVLRIPVTMLRFIDDPSPQTPPASATPVAATAQTVPTTITTPTPTPTTPTTTDATESNNNNNNNNNNKNESDKEKEGES